MNRSSALAVILVAIVALCAVPASQAEEYAHVGNKNCKKCHIKEFKSWEETKMASAYDSLKPGVDVEVKAELGLDPEKDYTTDETCVACHVTGYGKKGGFVDIESTPDLAGVGCESCHGPGGTYTQDEYMSLKNKEYKRSEVVAVGMVEKVGEAQCVACHNENVPIPDYKFDFAEMKDKGTHENFPLKYNHD